MRRRDLHESEILLMTRSSIKFYEINVDEIKRTNQLGLERVDQLLKLKNNFRSNIVIMYMCITIRGCLVLVKY